MVKGQEKQINYYGSINKVSFLFIYLFIYWYLYYIYASILDVHLKPTSI